MTVLNCPQKECEANKKDVCTLEEVFFYSDSRFPFICGQKFEPCERLKGYVPSWEPMWKGHKPILVNPEVIGEEEAERIGKKIDPNTGVCDRYERVHYAHPSIKKGCAGCKFNRFTFCIAPSKSDSCNKTKTGDK